ncbi:MAG: phosphohistidine phosphatase SixA [Deltaproteobacteria bacterium]|nr:phosphohistidine phosphatase SixA [Deltaproteobacteria bacterium]
MAIFLVQHGKSLSKEQDPEQGLSQQGIDEVKRIGAVAKGYSVPVKSIVHSVKKRARQTAEIFASAFQPTGGVQEMEGLKPLDDVTVFAETLKSGSQLMVVGHLPFMERLTSFLITGDINCPVFRFQNGGIVCMEEGPDGKGWVIKWTLMPEIG